MLNPVPITRDVLLIGGGHAHALLLRMWGMDPLPGARVTLVNPDPFATYTGMLPGLVAGHYQEQELEIDLVRLARFAGARIILGKVHGLDPEAKQAHVEGRPPISYDVASINIGATSALPGIPGETSMAAVRPLGAFATAWQGFIRSVEQGALPIAGVVGAGLGGVELALAMAHRLETVRKGEGRVHLFERSAQILPEGDKLRAKLQEALEARDIAVHTDFEAGAFENGMFTDLQGRETKLGFLGLAAGVKPAEWLGETGLELNEGFVCVDKNLRSVSHGDVFAVGDIAHMRHAPRPKAGVFAVRQTPVLFKNIRAAVSGQRLKAFKPQKDYLKLVSLGGQEAIAEKHGRLHQGPLMWRWKNRIDRAFMGKLTDLKPMAAKIPKPAATGVSELMQQGPLCGGCGAKVGQGALQDALASLPKPQREDIEQGAGDDAAILQVGGARQVVTTDHFRAFIDDPYQFARITAKHALGDIWAMGAKPQSALVSVILPGMSEALQAETLRELLAGAREVLTDAGAEIVGGHSSTGAEMTLGFTLTGLIEGRAVTLKGAEPGDALVLTKPLGVGTVLAGDMQMVARGADVANALEVMNRDVGGDAALLSPVAHAMTDVTGFGLAGHLKAMLDTVDLGAELQIDAIPFIDGAVELATRGVHSSLFAQNRFDLTLSKPLKKDARVDLLFDPQTAGGVLAALPLPEAEKLVDDLSGLGWIIGRVTAEAGISVS